jgi:hypothetical protein
MVSLSIRIYMLHQAIAKAKRETARFDQLWREAWREWTKTQDRLRKAHADRNMWRDKWKAGAFEMDAATMTKLAEQEGEAPYQASRSFQEPSLEA